MDRGYDGYSSSTLVAVTPRSGTPIQSITGSTTTTTTGATESNLKKICLVCGDKALGYNFNAITCESCKAFFRRNALKQKVFKCPFREQCEITVLSRRFCQKCRLRKCLEVGMLTDLIMTTRSGEARANNGGDGCGGMKIRKRRRHRDSITSANSMVNGYNGYNTNSSQYANDMMMMNLYNNSQCDGVGGTIDQISPTTIIPTSMPYPRIDKMDTDQWHNSAQFYSTEPLPMLPEYFDCDYDEYNNGRAVAICSPEAGTTFENNNDERFESSYNYEERKPSLMAMSDIHLETETMAVLQPCNNGATTTRSNSSNSDQQQSRHQYHQNQQAHGNETTNMMMMAARTLSDTMVTRTTRTNGTRQHWHALEADCIPMVLDFTNTLSAFNLFRLEELLSANEIMAVPNRGPPISFADSTLADQMGEVCLRRCFQLARRVQAFRNLLQHDQITLLKGAATELMALRGLWVYQPHVDSWRPVGFPHRYLRLECTKTNEKIRRFYSLFPNEWRTNDPIMLCLSQIILFDPNQPNLLDRESVRSQQQYYYDLLKEYLRTTYSDVGEKYWRVCQLLTILRQKVLKLMPALRVDVDPQDLEILSVGYNWRQPQIDAGGGAMMMYQGGQQYQPQMYGEASSHSSSCMGGVTITPIDDE